ncbi:MAG: hypothetical protein LBO20_02560 [Bifidobacteriaceae bacterium]|jgi:hypothetical protein|nr:hypothetical protein [Bifidobacteriaceae bacterium]
MDAPVRVPAGVRRPAGGGGGRPAGALVYLDLEEDVQRALEEEIEIGHGDLAEELGSGVRNVLELDSSLIVGLGNVSHKANAWCQAMDWTMPPPVLPVLAVFSLAAEWMRSADGFRSNNYCQRLVEVLQLNQSRQSKLSEAVRLYVERLWNALHLWLDAWEGLRGTQTAVCGKARNNRYIGYALSQGWLPA